MPELFSPTIVQAYIGSTLPAFTQEAHAVVTAPVTHLDLRLHVRTPGSPALITEVYTEDGGLVYVEVDIPDDLL